MSPTVARQKWADRKFDFVLSASQFPNLLERLRGTPARLEERTLGLAAPILTRRDGDKWSAQEHAGHLLGLEALWRARVEQLFAAAAELAPADMASVDAQAAASAAGPLRGLLDAFRAARRELVLRLSQADEETVLRGAMHARLGRPMRLVDLAFFVAEHDDHHLAAITELRERWGAGAD